MDAKPKVMVVDDDKTVRHLTGSLLSPNGYDVILAEDGIDALAKATKTLPDIILLDIKMPKMDGLEVARRLKTSKRTKIIPIVIMSILGEVEDRVKAMRAGADDFLVKPVDKNELLTRVSTLLKVKEYNDHMVNRQKELEAEVARLRLLVPRPDQTEDELVWRDHMRGVPLAALAKEFGCTKERMRYRLKRIAENKLHLTGGKDE